MRNLVGLALGSLVLAAAAGCKTGGSPAGDDDTTPDGAVAGNPDAAPASDLAPPPAGEGFQLKSPEITLAPGEEATYCYYLTVPVTAVTGVKKWESQMTPGSHHLILYFTSAAQNTDGALTKDCNPLGGGGLNPPVWTYSAQSITQSAAMPDGIGMTVAANQKAFIQMHYLNTSDKELKAHVTVNGWTFASGTSYNPAAAYVTYMSPISIPKMSGPEMGVAHVEGSCDVPAGVQFFTLSTHAHRRATHTQVTDGSSMVFQSDNWEHPGAQNWSSPTFYSFGTKLTYHCDYKNDLDQVVKDGNSAQTNEMCMAVGYFFCPAGGSCSPATKPVFCVGSSVIPL